MKIIYRTETGISVIHPTGEVPIEEVAKKSVPSGSDYVIVDDDAIPGDRHFRSAWELSGVGVSIDMTKAVEITKDRLRAERAPALDAQDVAFMRAIEIGESVAEIVAEKQRLRDITKLADAAKTPEELRAIKV